MVRIGKPPLKRTWIATMWWAYSNPAWIGFCTPVANDHRWIVRHEMLFHREIPENAAAKILDFCHGKRIQLSSTFLQPKLFPKKGEYGETISETFRRSGLPVRPGTSDREASLSRIRSWLTPITIGTETKSPTLLVHEECEYLIRTLPSLEEDQENEEDIAMLPEAFPALALGFFVMSRPMPRPPGPDALPPGAIGHDVNELRRKAAQR
jgi:hypothetical protein